MRLFRFILTLGVIVSGAGYAQHGAGDTALFDFWIGEWDLTWNDPDGTTARGSNTISKILDGSVIHENFTALSGRSKGFKGQSFSVLDNRTKTWKQTWVDNQNSYLPFTGGAEGNNRFFSQEFVRNGALIRQKMVFRDITNNSLTWEWMNSLDSGTTWKTNWTILYKRKR